MLPCSTLKVSSSLQHQDFAYQCTSKRFSPNIDDGTAWNDLSSAYHDAQEGAVEPAKTNSPTCFKDHEAEVVLEMDDEWGVVNVI